jgi:hypothetical protein
MGLNLPLAEGTIWLAIPGRTRPGPWGAPYLPHGPKRPQAGASQARSTSTTHLRWTARSKNQMYKRSRWEGSNPSLHSRPFFFGVHKREKLSGVAIRAVLSVLPVPVAMTSRASGGTYALGLMRLVAGTKLEGVAPWGHSPPDDLFITA